MTAEKTSSNERGVNVEILTSWGLLSTNAGMSKTERSRIGVTEARGTPRALPIAPRGVPGYSGYPVGTPDVPVYYTLSLRGGLPISWMNNAA